jgi:small-conductance mechanosensitive channel
MLTEFAENGINLELGFWVSDPETGTGGVRSDINLAIWKAFRANGIEIPSPQREVRILGAALKADDVVPNAAEAQKKSHAGTARD